MGASQARQTGLDVSATPAQTRRQRRLPPRPHALRQRLPQRVQPRAGDGAHRKHPGRRIRKIALGRNAENRRLFLTQQLPLLRPRRFVGRQTQQQQIGLSRLLTAERLGLFLDRIFAVPPAGRVHQLDHRPAEVETAAPDNRASSPAPG